MNNLITMLRELDLEKNDTETIREVLDFIADELEQKENIIKEAREYVEGRYDGEVLTHTFDKCNVGELLEILDKENK